MAAARGARPAHGPDRARHPQAGVLAPLALALAVALGGCGGTSAAPEAAQPSPRLGPVSLLVPAGARLVGVARPRVLWEALATRRVVEALLPPGEPGALAQRTGLDLRQVERLVFAEYPEGSMVIAQGGLQAEDVVRRGERRMVPVAVHADVPYPRRGGLVGTRWRELVALRPDVLVMVNGQVGDALTAMLARARRGAWPPGARPALGHSVARALHAAWREAPLGIHVPEPVALPPGHDVSLLLARQRALTVALGPEGDREVGLTVDLRGTFPEGAEHNFDALARHLATSDMGGALGLEEGLSTLQVTSEPCGVTLRMQLHAAALAEGIALLLGSRDHHPLGLDPGQM